MKIVSATDAAALIQSDWTVATAGFSSSGLALAVTGALERRFLTSGLPRDLTLVHAAGQGNRTQIGNGQTGGDAHFAHDGMVKRVISGHWGGSIRLAEMASEGKIDGYNLPQGVISQLFRAIAGAKPGLVSQIGLHTFVDPRYGGGHIGENPQEPLVDLVTLRGTECLFYRSFPIHCAILRGTTADTHGNISAEQETVVQDMLAVAQAAHNSGGIVIAQVKRLSEIGTIHPQMVRVPGILVDYVVVAEPSLHWQTAEFEYNPAFTGEVREPLHAHKPLPLDIRKVIARRALLELADIPHPVVNLGTGIPAGIGAVAREEGISGLTFTVEAGTIGGFPASEPTFGAALNPEAIVDQPSQFDFYDGGGLDISFLGFGEVDGEGSVNVSRFGRRFNGVGGFINITQSTKRLVFCGTFTGGGLEVRVEDGVRVLREGEIRKFVRQVSHLSFNGPYATRQGIQATYVTERGVFRLRDGAIVLTEIAPGIDLVRDILNKVDAKIIVDPALVEMDRRIFRTEVMGIATAGFGPERPKAVLPEYEATGVV